MMKPITPANVKITFVNNGVPDIVSATENEKEITKAEFNISADSKLIVALGRLSPEKNIKALINVFSKISPYQPQYKLLIVGDGPSREKLEEHVNNAGASESIIMTGYQSNPERFLSLATVYINCSKFEGLSLSILEAMRASLPVIATPVGAAPHIIEHQVNGILTKSFEELDLKNELDKVMSDYYDLDILGNAARKLYESEYTIDRFSERYFLLYKGALEK